MESAQRKKSFRKRATPTASRYLFVSMRKVLDSDLTFVVLVLIISPEIDIEIERALNDMQQFNGLKCSSLSAVCCRRELVRREIGGKLSGTRGHEQHS